MSNKEIRVSNQLWQRVVPHQTVIHITPESMDTVIDQIQEATRQDERKRVIKEIDLPQILIRLSKIKQCGTCARCEEMLDYIISKLNQLK